MDEALYDLGTFTFVALHLLSVDRQHTTAIADLPRIIEVLEDIHTDVHGMIKSPHLAMALFFDVSRS